jgi:hypothetical protein
LATTRFFANLDNHPIPDLEADGSVHRQLIAAGCDRTRGHNVSQARTMARCCLC